ncbi:MAG: hypothetical protein ABIL01_14660 [Pseudomonadota bacterium]
MMSQGTSKPPNSATIPVSAMSWTRRRLTLFCCFMFSGIVLDAYFGWYSFHFAAACKDSGNSVPDAFPLFSAISAIPAATSILFGHKLVYEKLCLGVWIFYVGISAFLILESHSIENQFGVNCYRDVGSTGAVAFAFTLIFATAIVALTLASGVIVLTRRFLLRWSRTRL